MGTTPRAADEIPTPRGQVRTTGVLRPRYYLPGKSSKWGQMHTNLLVGSADEPAAGFQGDTGALISPLARTTAESGAKVTRMQEIFAQKITKIYENRTKAAKSLANTSLFDIKQGFLEACEGERASVGKGLRNSAPMQWQRIWVSLSASKGLLLYDPHTQDLLDPVQTIEVKSILHCKAEDTCVFSVESMIDDFLGSWSFFFRAESRGERDAWITAIDRQIVGQSPMTSAHSRSFHRTPASKVQSPVSARNSLKISALISPRSASLADNHQVMSPKRRRFFDDTDTELKKMQQSREHAEAVMGEVLGEVHETLQELEQTRNVLWCKDIASVLTAQKIRANFQEKANKGREAAAVKALIQVSGSRSDLTGDDMVIVSPSGRLGCMVVFNTENEAKKAIQAISFHAGHDGEILTSQLISEGQLVSIARQFSSDSDLQAPSTGSKSASHPVLSASAGHARAKDKDERQQPNASDAKGALVSHSATGVLQTRPSNRPAGWSFQNEKLISSIAQRRQKKELELLQKRSTQSQDAASAKLFSALSSSSSKKVELRALMPNPTVFSYLLVRYNPVQSSIEMEYVTNEKTHSLWTGAITDLAVAPTGTGGNVSVLGGGQCAVQVGQRHWDQFASLAKTKTLMIQALEKHMIDPLDLERHTAKYTNIQEPVSDRIFVGKARQQAARHWTEARKSSAATTRGKNTGVSSARATLETDTATLMIGMHEFSEILTELSEVPKEQLVVNQNVDPEVLTLVADIAEACTELPDVAGYDFTTTWLNSIVQSDDARSPKEIDENKGIARKITVKSSDNQNSKLPLLDKNTHNHTELTTVPATQKPRKMSTHTRPKIVPPLRIPAVVHGGRVDTWDHRTRHDGLTNPHLKLDPAHARSYTARISTREDAETKNL